MYKHPFTGFHDFSLLCKDKVSVECDRILLLKESKTIREALTSSKEYQKKFLEIPYSSKIVMGCLCILDPDGAQDFKVKDIEYYQSLLLFAESFQIDKVINFCYERLYHALTDDTKLHDVINIYEKACLFNNKPLVERCEAILCKEPARIGEWLQTQIPRTNFSKLLCETLLSSFSKKFRNISKEFKEMNDKGRVVTKPWGTAYLEWCAANLRFETTGRSLAHFVKDIKQLGKEEREVLDLFLAESPLWGVIIQHLVK